MGGLPPEHQVALGNLLGEPVPGPGSTPAPEPEPEVDPRDARIEALQKEVADTKTHLSEANATMRRVMENMQKQSASAPQPQAPQITDEQLDAMTPAQLTKFLVGTIAGVVTQQNQANVVELTKIRLEGQLKDLYGADPEGFTKHQEDIVNIVREKNGNITPEEALVIAKHRSRDSSEEPEEGKEEPTRPRAVASRGTTPGTRAGSGGRPGKPTPPPANAREAAQRAMKAIFPGGVRRG